MTASFEIAEITRTWIWANHTRLWNKHCGCYPYRYMFR